MESALMIVPPSAWASLSASADLPLAVGPAMRMAVGMISELDRHRYRMQPAWQLDCARLKLEQPLRVAAQHLVAICRRHVELTDQVDALLLERIHRRRVGAEQEMIGAHRIERALCG